MEFPVPAGFFCMDTSLKKQSGYDRLLQEDYERTEDFYELIKCRALKSWIW